MAVVFETSQRTLWSANAQRDSGILFVHGVFDRNAPTERRKLYKPRDALILTAYLFIMDSNDLNNVVVLVTGVFHLLYITVVSINDISLTL